MKRINLALLGVAFANAVAADNLAGVDTMICSTAQANLCLETGQCFATTPWELALPDFVVVDLKRKTIATTKSSSELRSTEATMVKSEDGLIYLQGIERSRAFSFVIDEATGRMTAAVSRDGLSVAVFGACTSTDT